MSCQIGLMLGGIVGTVCVLVLGIEDEVMIIQVDGGVDGVVDGWLTVVSSGQARL